MLTLPEAIQSLQNDLAEALAAGGPAAFGRISVTLSLALAEPMGGAGQPRFVVVPGAGGPHTLALELMPAPASGAAPAAPPAPAGPPGTAPSDIDSLFNALCGVFGTPGFDSSARATVFRECLAALESKQADDLAATLGQKAPAGEDSAVSLARTRISRLASLVSGEPGQALKALAAQATRFSSAQMIALAAERWKTQDDWIER